nr:hypothetical protein GCM10025699_04130 [Microbacterium flavescens]
MGLAVTVGIGADVAAPDDEGTGSELAPVSGAHAESTVTERRRDAAAAASRDIRWDMCPTLGRHPDRG